MKFQSHLVIDTLFDTNIYVLRKIILTAALGGLNLSLLIAFVRTCGVSLFNSALIEFNSFHLLSPAASKTHSEMIDGYHLRKSTTSYLPAEMIVKVP